MRIMSRRQVTSRVPPFSDSIEPLGVTVLVITRHVPVNSFVTIPRAANAPETVLISVRSSGSVIALIVCQGAKGNVGALSAQEGLMQVGLLRHASIKQGAKAVVNSALKKSFRVSVFFMSAIMLVEPSNVFGCSV